MKKGLTLKIITILALIVYLVLGIYSFSIGLRSYVMDAVMFSFFTVVLYLIRNKINLKPFVFILVELGLIFHNLGVFGFYNVSPIPIYWDHLTHGFGLFSISLLLFNMLSLYIKDNKILIPVVLLACLGLGSLIEVVEYSGYLVFGPGEGFLLYGAGDFEVDKGLSSDWLDAMDDLVWNIYGSLLGILVYFVFKKKI